MLAPQVSVLMPVFNASKYLLKALRSISSQTLTRFEFLVVDDGSRDNSASLLRAYATEESRMTVVVRENRGLIATRNELLAAARGELIAWMDSDDISDPNRLARQVVRLKESPDLVCVGGFAQCIDPAGRFLNTEIYPVDHAGITSAQQSGGGVRFPTTMMRRDVVVGLGGFREPFSIGEDFDLLLRLGETGKLANLPSVIYFYRQHMDSVCASLGPAWFAYRDQILELARQRRENGCDTLQQGGAVEVIVPPLNMDQWVPKIYASWSKYALENGNRSVAWEHAVSAVLAEPMVRTGWGALLRVILDRKRNESPAM